MILLQSYSPTTEIMVDLSIPLIYAVKDKSTNTIRLGRFTEEDIQDNFFYCFSKLLSHSSCDISDYLFLIKNHNEQFVDCDCKAEFEILNKNFESRRMKLVGSENIARYLNTHTIDSSFKITIAK